MTFELPGLFVVGVGYLLLLFLIAYAAERGWVPTAITRHPLVYVLSLGVYATSWSYYGSVGFARNQGYNFLTVYLGVTLAFLLTPVLLLPILRLTRRFQLTSLADLFAFRYRSQLAGILVTLFMLTGTLPYIALQIQAVTESIGVLSQEAAPTTLALGFCICVTVFAILFGARHISPREKHEGLVLAIAFESLVKLLALLSVGAFALFGVFGGPSGVDSWLEINPAALDALYRPVTEGPWATYLLLAFAAAFLLPRQFHMSFTENLVPRALPVAAWGFPLFLLLLNLPIPLILWAGQVSGTTVAADYYVLGITLEGGGTLLPLIAYIGGISSASAMMIVTTLALSSMCLNHLLLPLTYPDPKLDVYRWLLWGRRLLIGLIIFAGFVFYLILQHNRGLVELGLISFVAVAQFLPGVFGLLYWPRATRLGFLAGLGAGALIWAGTLLVPLLGRAGAFAVDPEVLQLVDPPGQDKWQYATFWSLAVNGLLFVVFSLLTRPDEEEREAAYACVLESMAPPRGVVTAESTTQFRQQLAQVMGPKAAEHEVRQALDDLEMASDEARPNELRRLRDRIERNLSGLMGPEMARMIVDTRLRLNPREQTALGDSMRFIEERLERSRSQLRGLAVELDSLRRYHRQVLQDLPIGVCSVGPANEVVIWNLAMELISGISRAAAVGTPLAELPAPWATLLGDFSRTDDLHVHKRQLVIGGRLRSFNLHRAALASASNDQFRGRELGAGGMVLLLEDLTDISTLEAELAHSERLASIGRLAAGVAHEIGNPVTGIACLAQNLREEHDPDSLRESVEAILEQTRRITEIVHSLVSFSHSGQLERGTRTPVVLHDIVDEAMRLVRLSHSGRQVTCVNGCDTELQLLGDRQRLGQVLVNLLTNACHASQPGDRVEVHAQQRGDRVTVEIRDQGCGMPKAVRERIFEPFFTTREPGEGTGLGLSLVYSIVQDHGGSITVDSSEGHGTRMLLDLPGLTQSASSAAAATPVGVMPGSQA
jgi:Na+/proline symporter/signal transduction histidine kinase